MRGKSAIRILSIVLSFFVVSSAPVHAASANVKKGTQPTNSGSAKSSQNTPQMKAPGRTTTAVQLKAQPANEPVIESVTGLKPGLEAGGTEVDVMLRGKNLDRLTSGQVLMMNSPAGDIQVRLGPPTPTIRRVTLKAGEKAQIGNNYKLRFFAGARGIDVPAGSVTISVQKLKGTAELKAASKLKGIEERSAVGSAGGQQLIGRNSQKNEVLAGPHGATRTGGPGEVGPGALNPLTKGGGGTADHPGRTTGALSSKTGAVSTGSVQGTAGHGNGSPRSGIQRPFEASGADQSASGHGGGIRPGAKDSIIGSQKAGGDNRPSASGSGNVGNGSAASLPKYVPGENGRRDAYQYSDGGRFPAEDDIGGKGQVTSEGTIQYPFGVSASYNPLTQQATVNQRMGVTTTQRRHDRSFQVYDPETGAKVEFGDHGDSTYEEGRPKPDTDSSGTTSHGSGDTANVPEWEQGDYWPSGAGANESPPKFVPGQNGQPDSYQWGDGRQAVADGGGGRGKVQSDGSVQYPDGTKVSHNPGTHDIVIHHPDGTIHVSSMAGGPKLNKSSQGDEVFEFSDGTQVLARDQFGNRGTVTSNGHIRYADGTEVYNVGGDVHIIHPDGREVIHHRDGSVTVHDRQSGATIEFGDQGDSTHERGRPKPADSSSGTTNSRTNSDTGKSDTGGSSDTGKSDTGSSSDTGKSDTGGSSDTGKSDTGGSSDTGKSDTGGSSDTGKSDSAASDNGSDKQTKESNKPYDSYSSGGSGPSAIAGTKIEDKQHMRRDRDEEGNSGSKPCKPGSQPVPGENCTRETVQAGPSAVERSVGLPYDTSPGKKQFESGDTDRFRDNSAIQGRTFDPFDKRPVTNPNPN
jgi:hypothetical protein